MLRRALIRDGTEVAAKAIGAAGCLVPSEVTPIIHPPLCTHQERITMTRYYTSVIVFMFALPIGTLLFGGFGAGRGFAAGAAVATVCAIFTYIFWPKLKDNSAPGQDSSGTSQDSSE